MPPSGNTKYITWAAGVFSLCLVLTAATCFITQILDVHLDLLIVLLY